MKRLNSLSSFRELSRSRLFAGVTHTYTRNSSNRPC